MSKIVINQDTTFVSDASDIITTLNGLSDVTITSASNGQLLVYNNSTSQWVNTNISSAIGSIDDLGDVTITTPADGDILVYNNSTSTWENRDEIDGGTY